MTDPISSLSNPIAKRVRALAERKVRKREQAFLVEGMQPVWRAVESGWKIEALIVAPELIENPAIDEMVDDLATRGTRIVEMSAALFSKLSDRDGPSGVMAIVQMQSSSFDSTQVNEGDAWIILYRIHNPGNLGTILRTADATGMSGVVLTGDSTDPFSPVAVKASMGSIFSVPMVIEPELDSVVTWASEQGMQLVGTSGYAENAHWSASWERPLGIVLGNEGDGLPDELLTKLDSNVRIPMTGTAESLNLGVAAALLMYEVQRHLIR